MIAPGFESHNASQVHGIDGSAAMLAIRMLAGVAPEVNLSQAQIRLPTLALKPRGDITRSPKQGYQCPTKGLMSSKFFLTKNTKNPFLHRLLNNRLTSYSGFEIR